ncbi:DUF1176 domain-containing protein [Sphingosinicella sp. CPCC 101087]|uniref:DUF1176 domain-containing protein n=1 Tax=Sphingosinicella sp. CPCC 101087 TaxID=2497754 RepID=UPI00101B9F9A|nr:DUF1176 domain-containing protein [Sphingosinicella sp. CPCC 101087]
MIWLFLAAAAAAPAPVPSELEVFRDWIVGCDNGRACQAIALLPENAEWEQWLTFSVSRGGASGDAPIVTLPNLDREPAALLADGRPLAVRFAAQADGYSVVSDDATRFFAALRQSETLEARSSGGEAIGRISLAGATAALLYMDDRQGRVGTVTALARPGAMPASRVPDPPPRPRLNLAPAPIGEAAIPADAAGIEALRREVGCTTEEVGGPDHHEAVAIAPATTLILLACGSGAYNVTSIPFIAKRRGEAFAVDIAPFASQWGREQAELRRPTLINAEWDPQSRLLKEYRKGRGLGDCGVHAEYGWDGERFQLVRQEEMSECRGSLQYITTWRSDVEPP